MKNNNKIWTIKQSTDPKTLDIYIYGDVQGDYTDFTGENVKSKTSANYFKEELAKYPDTTNINLYINSYGGSLSEGMSIRNQLKRHKAYVTGYVDGFACSVASFILTGCNKVKMYSNTMQLIHNAWIVVAGNSNDLRKQADDLDQIMEGNRTAYLEKAKGKITEKKLIELLNAETWLTADECLKYGFADEIISEQVDLTTAKQKIQNFSNLNNNHNIVAKFNKKNVNVGNKYLECVLNAISDSIGK